MSSLQRALLAWYDAAGRAALPWRATRDPYAIVVSEVMLQQTQVDRVVPKYRAFLAAFPTLAALAAAPAADVLRAWKGLGYNSRALRLKRLAERVTAEHGGAMPRDPEQLADLPGMGPYTVAAVRAFAFGEDDAAIDTNVRRVVHRALFGVEHPPRVTQRELDAAARRLVPPGGGHDWNSAMMDLGATLCTARAPKCLLCPLAAHCAAAPVDAAALETARRRHAAPRSPQERIPFEATTRYARGRIVDRLRDLAPGERISLLDLRAELEPLVKRERDDFDAVVRGLVRDGLVQQAEEGLALP